MQTPDTPRPFHFPFFSQYISIIIVVVVVVVI
jgi:hypothetical protein